MPLEFTVNNAEPEEPPSVTPVFHTTRYSGDLPSIDVDRPVTEPSEYILASPAGWWMPTIAVPVAPIDALVHDAYTAPVGGAVFSSSSRVSRVVLA